MMVKKVFGVFFGIAFLAFVVVQYNDPDPVLWMAIYGLAALLSFLAVFNKVRFTVLGIVTVLYMVGGIYMWPDQYEGLNIGDGDITNIEEARESLGLFLCSIAFISYMLLDMYSRHSERKATLKQKAKWAR